MNTIKIYWDRISHLHDHPRTHGTYRNLLQMLGLPRRLPEAAVELGISFECLKKRLNRCDSAWMAADALNVYMRSRHYARVDDHSDPRRQRALALLAVLEPKLQRLFAPARKYGPPMPSPTPEQEAEYRRLIAEGQEAETTSSPFVGVH